MIILNETYLDSSRVCSSFACPLFPSIRKQEKKQNKNPITNMQHQKKSLEVSGLSM